MIRVALFAGLLVWATGPEAHAAESADLAQELLITRCARCHGADVRRPKGAFGLATDLRALARDPRYIRPGDPAASPLLRIARSGRTQAITARAHNLGREEIETLATWIAAGAPPPTSPAPPGAGEVRSFTRFVGQFHPLAVHFPVALIIAAALAELIGAVRKSESFPRVARYCLTLGALGTLVASMTGWAWANGDSGVEAHGRLGLATTCFAVGACLFSLRQLRGPGTRSDRRIYALVLLVTLVLLVMTGHQGGQITHGPVQAWRP